MSVGQVTHEIFHSKAIRNRILFTIAMLVVFRIAAHIPLPGADLSKLGNLLSGNQLLSIFSLLTGGGIEKLSIVMMGVSPYITASIIVQLLTVVVPKWEHLSKEGERGQRIINRWTRILTLPLGLIQAYGLLALLTSTQDGQTLFEQLGAGTMLWLMFLTTAGTMLLLWIGDLITESGIGNGISVLIFAGIVAGVPGLVSSYASLAMSGGDTTQIGVLLAAAIFTLAMIVLIVLVTDAHRKIPITYATKAAQGGASLASSSFIPIPVNQAGMIPIIFAVSLLALPGLLANYLQAAKTAWISESAKWVITNFTQNSAWYLLTYFLLIVAFTFFYVSVSFNPEQVAENIQKRGGFVPGLRPGKQTAEYLGTISRRLTLLGSFFIAIVAILPLSIRFFSSDTFGSTIPVLVSGAGLIIIVGVVLELVRQVNAQLLMQDYEKFSA